MKEGSSMELMRDFEVLWEQEKKQIHSAILLQEKKKDGISSEDLQQAYEAITRKWTDSFSAESGFMKRMRQMNPDFADEFQKKMMNFSFAAIPKPVMPSPFPYIIAEAVVGMAGVGTGYLLASKSIIGRFINVKIVVLLAAIAVVAMTAGIARDMWQNKKQKAWHEIGDGYRNQVEVLGRELKNLCKEKEHSV